ncbi:MAG: hypothetical protein ABJB01_03800 [Rudaea sp.]
MFDQWRMYQTLLAIPFPHNVLVLENGHHPIIPNTIRYAEVQWFAADQLLQIGIGISCALMSVLILCLIGWRERGVGFGARSAAVMLPILGIFWLANARILMHGNEALHAYLLVLSVVVAAVFTYRAAQCETNGWLVAASAACAVAMFCFGPGVASFPAVIALGILLRISWRRLVIPGATLVILLLIYLYALPGDEGVRSMLSLRPWESTKIAMTWLSSPWATEWLGLAQPPLYPQMVERFNAEGQWQPMVVSANALVSATGLPWRTLSMLFGFAGTIYFGIRTAYTFLQKSKLTLLQSLATMLCVFALATSFVIGVGRLSYFSEHSGQVFADRYLIWPCLFWTGLALLTLGDVFRARVQWPRLVFGACVVALPLALYPMHDYAAGWSSVVYNSSQRMAASARSGIVDADVVTSIADIVPEYTKTLAVFKQRNLAMFADPAWRLLDQPWTGSIDATTEIEVDAYWMETFDSERGTAHHLRGIVKRGVGKLRNGFLALLTDDNRIAGFAEFSFVGKGKKTPLFLSLPRKRGFDGYVAGTDSTAHYRLVWLRLDSGRGTLLADLPRK